jgi:hypothetical protein
MTHRTELPIVAAVAGFLLIAGAALPITHPAFAQGSGRPGPPPGTAPPGFATPGPPQFRLATVLYTSSLNGIMYRCSVLNTTAQPLSVSIVVVTETNEPHAAADVVIPPREVRFVDVEPESVLGIPIGFNDYCRITFQGESGAVRGVLQAHNGEIALPPPGGRVHHKGSTSSEAR